VQSLDESFAVIAVLLVVMPKSGKISTKKYLKKTFPRPLPLVRSARLPEGRRQEDFGCLCLSYSVIDIWEMNHQGDDLDDYFFIYNLPSDVFYGSHLLSPLRCFFSVIYSSDYLSLPIPLVVK